MAYIAVMPKLGLTMTEGIVTKWHKAEGDSIKAGDILFEVTTEKFTSEVTAESAGILRKIIAAEGETVPCKDPVAIIAGAGEDISLILPDIKSPEAVHETVSFKASPAAKKLADDNSIDIRKLTGTGPQGRIVFKDVEDHLKNSRVKYSPTAIKLAEEMGVDINNIHKAGRIMKEDVLAVKHSESVIPLSNLRKVISKRMSESWSISPMVTYNTSADMTQMKALRSNLQDEFSHAGIKLTYNHIIMKICAKVLLEMPYLNGSLEGEELILHNNVNIGLAVSVDNGLLVPNVKNVENKSLLAIAEETERLIDNARSNRLLPDDMSFGTFTITNAGMYGIEAFTPIINQPELAILGIAAIIEKPVAIDGEVKVRPMMNLSLTADHRVIDGAEASKFLKRIKEIIENPYLILL